MYSHIYGREREKCLSELLMVLKTDILFALEFSSNYFLNACNCFKAALPLTHGKSNNFTGFMKH